MGNEAAAAAEHFLRNYKFASSERKVELRVFFLCFFGLLHEKNEEYEENGNNGSDRK